MSLARQCTAEFLGTAMLVVAVVGSGIMGERLAGGNPALALLANSIATGAALVALIYAFMDISGAHFNPLVTLSGAMRGSISWPHAAAFTMSQMLGGVAGVGVANRMFGLPWVLISQHPRSGGSLLFSEVVATFGLLVVIGACARSRLSAVPLAVAAYITGAYWFTSSTSFANPAVTLARALSDTFAGIRPHDVPGFMAAQFVGAALATALLQWLFPRLRPVS